MIPSSDPVQVIVHDPEGPRKRRWAIAVISPIVIAASYLPWGWDSFISALLFFGGSLPAILAPLLVRRRRPFEATLRHRNGAVEIARRLRGSDKIASADILGSVVVGQTLYLMLRGRRFAVALRHATSSDVDRSLSALGLRRRHTGAVEWDLSVSKLEYASVGARVLAAVWWTLFGIFGLHPGFGYLLVLVTFAAAIALYVAAQVRQRDTLTLTDDALIVRSAGVVRSIPRDDIADLRAQGAKLVVVRRSGASVSIAVSSSRALMSGSGADEIEQMSSVIRSKPSSAEAPESLDQLHRQDESLQSWIARLDAAHLDAKPVGVYRGGLTIDAVWAALRNPETSDETRVAAARLIARADDTRYRVSEVLPLIANESLRVRVTAMMSPDPAEVLASFKEDEEQEDVHVAAPIDRRVIRHD